MQPNSFPAKVLRLTKQHEVSSIWWSTRKCLYGSPLQYRCCSMLRTCSNLKRLTEPFKEYRDTVHKCSAEFEQIDPIERPFIQHPKTTKIGSFYEHVRELLKVRLVNKSVEGSSGYPMEDRWGHLMKRNNLDRHKVLEKTVNNRGWSKFKRHISFITIAGLTSYSFETSSDTLWASEAQI